MTTPPDDEKHLTLISQVIEKQRDHMRMSRDTNSIAHALKVLLELVGEGERMEGPLHKTPGGLIQGLVDQIAALQESHDRHSEKMLAELIKQTRMLQAMEQALGLLPHPSDNG